MVLDTAVIKEFYLSLRDASKFPNITLVTSLTQITDGSNVLQFMGRFQNGKDYFFQYDKIQLEPPKVPVDLGEGPLLSLSNETRYSSLAFDPETVELYDATSEGRFNHVYFYTNQVDNEMLFLVK